MPLILPMVQADSTVDSDIVVLNQMKNIIILINIQFFEIIFKE